VIPLALMVVLLVAVRAPAQDQPPEARELARLIFNAGTFDAIMTQAGKVGSQVVRAGIEGRLAEMRELAAFYRTRLGGKALRLSGVLVSEGAAAGERLVNSREREFAERFGAEFAREFPALSRELERQPPR
jgi:hypothetical protein